MVGLAGLYGIAYAAGGEADWDLTSPNFGKIKIAGRVVDPLFGLAPVIRILHQNISGISQHKKGQVRPLRPTNMILPYWRKQISGRPHDKPGAMEETGASVTGKFLWSKLAPAPETWVSGVAGENVAGKEFVLSERALRSLSSIRIGI